MKRTIIVDAVILALALPVAVAVMKWSGATQPVWQLAVAAFSSDSSGILSSSFAQTLILLGPLSAFLCLTILAIIKGKWKTSCVLAALTSACWAFLMVGTLFVRFGP